jgi:hypothetical protein
MSIPNNTQVPLDSTLLETDQRLAVDYLSPKHIAWPLTPLLLTPLPLTPLCLTIRETTKNRKDPHKKYSIPQEFE